MDRREFLGVVAATLALGADRPAGKMTLGFSLYGMKSLPLDDALKACAAIGYDAVELALLPGYPTEPAKLSKEDRKRLKDRLGELKLGLPALMENLPLDGDAKKRQERLDRLKDAIQLAHDLGGERPPVIETVLGGKAGQWDAVKEDFAVRLREWAKIAADARVTVCIKPHRFNAMATPDQALWLLKQVESPFIRLVYDWSHFENTGLEMAKTVAALVPSSPFVHVKDTVFDGGKATFVLPGEGATDYGELVGLLAKNGYTGCVCVEVSSQVFNKKDYDPLVAAKKCYEKLAPAFAKTR